MTFGIVHWTLGTGFGSWGTEKADARMRFMGKKANWPACIKAKGWDETGVNLRAEWISRRMGGGLLYVSRVLWVTTRGTCFHK